MTVSLYGAWSLRRERYAWVITSFVYWANGGEAEDNCCRKNLKGKGDLKRLLIRFSWSHNIYIGLTKAEKRVIVLKGTNYYSLS
jgi:hypothetical protein